MDRQSAPTLDLKPSEALPDSAGQSANHGGGTPSHPAVALLRALFGDAHPDLHLEVRPVPTGLLDPSQRFVTIGELQRGGFDAALPYHLDGKADIFVGVCLRKRRRGKAVDIAIATCLWADADSGFPDPWPTDVPPPSAIVETSPGKFHLYWFLRAPCSDLALVERITKGIAAALPSDRAATDRARLLRLPGFRNIKPGYPDRPVAELRHLDPQRRYDIGDFADLAAAAPITGRHHKESFTASSSKDIFDPHRGGVDVPDPVKQEVDGELRRLGAQPCYDGRLTGPCPFPGHTGQSRHNFYFSPVSGRWWCFGDHHHGRREDTVCATGNIWTLWAALFGSRPTSQLSDLSTSPTLGERRHPRGEDAYNSPRSPYAPPAPAALEVLGDAPRHHRSADRLAQIGQIRKADAERHCGVPLKGRCLDHGVVREGRASGKTPWCAGCNTDTSARYVHATFPSGPYTILRLQRRIRPLLRDDGGVLDPGAVETDGASQERVRDAVVEGYETATAHFRRLQRRFGDECMGWHFAVWQDQDGLWIELQVLLRHTERLPRVLLEMSGETRQSASFRADAVVRSDYSATDQEQLQRDWAAMLRCTLLRLDDDELFKPIHEALAGRQLCQVYGALRASLAAVKEARETQREELSRCPVIEDQAGECGLPLIFFLDPLDEHPVSPPPRSMRPTAAGGDTQR